MQHIDDEIAKLLGAETVPDIDKALNHLRLMRALKRLEGYSPYAKQREFHDMGREMAERLLLAGNQTGKSECGAAEVAMHLTGRYPPWWTGRVWDRPTTWWVAGETSETTRDSIQQKLIGPYDKTEEWGTGYIPKDCIETIRLSSHSVANSIDFVTVRHTTGGLSNVAFKSYGKGRKRWQAVTIDGIWFDEEPPADVYSEGQTRVNVLQGSILITFTPLQGMSEVVGLFLTPEQVERMMTDAREW